MKSAIRERFANLVSQGFTMIVGVRDVRPVMFNEVPRLRTGLAQGLPKEPDIIRFVLAVMEIEAWFLAEYTHFEKIHANLNPTRVRETLGIDVINDDLQTRPNPASDLRDIYNLELLVYDKSKLRVNRTISVLNMRAVTENVALRFPDLSLLVKILREFIGEPTPPNSNNPWWRVLWEWLTSLFRRLGGSGLVQVLKINSIQRNWNLRPEPH